MIFLAHRRREQKEKEKGKNNYQQSTKMKKNLFVRDQIITKKDLFSIIFLLNKLENKESCTYCYYYHLSFYEIGTTRKRERNTN